MNTLLMAAMLVILPAERNAEEVVSVQMEGGAERATGTLLRARDQATRMFASAGVRLEWCERAERCRDWEGRLVVTLAPVAPARLAAGVRAEARVFEGRNIWIYLDRMPATAGARVNESATVWAHVLVHEITHMLQGCDHHAPAGVMKAHWTRQDLLAMQVEPLPFTSFDVRMIHAGLAARRARFADVSMAADEHR